MQKERKYTKLFVCGSSKQSKNSDNVFTLQKISIHVFSTTASPNNNLNNQGSYKIQCVKLVILGPVERTMNNVWRMIWEYNVPCIVMVTNFTEMSTMKVRLIERTIKILA